MRTFLRREQEIPSKQKAKKGEREEKRTKSERKEKSELQHSSLQN